MSQEDFDVARLARYLHITPQQVERLVSRGKLPARKVAGQWRFSPAEVHHWLEARMGLLEEEELAQMERQMAHADNQPVNELTITGMLGPDTVRVPLQAKTRKSVIDEMAQIAADAGMLWDPEKMADAVRAREDLQSTAMDSGVALMHPRRPLPNILAEPVLAVGIAPRGIPFGGSHRLTDVFFLICSTDDRGHLRTLARLSRLIGNEELLETLRAAESPLEVYERLCAAEAELFS